MRCYVVANSKILAQKEPDIYCDSSDSQILDDNSDDKSSVIEAENNPKQNQSFAVFLETSPKYSIGAKISKGAINSMGRVVKKQGFPKKQNKY